MKLQLAVAALCLGLSLHAQTPLRVSGSTTVKGALEPKQAILESAVGRPIEFFGSGTAAGLLSLVSGNTDMAMLSSPLDEVAHLINEKTPGKIDPATLSAVHIGEVKIVFIVNPHNTVRALNTAQLTDILLGKITNWKEVGGADIPVVVVTLANGGPLLQEQMLHGQSIMAKTRTVPSATHIPVVVAEDPSTIGIISTAHARGQTSVIQTDVNIIAPLYLVTKGAPAGAARTLIETAQKVLASSAAAGKEVAAK